MKKAIVLLSVLILGCGQKTQGPVDDSAVLAQVGELILTERLLQAGLASRGIKSPDESQKKKVFEEMVSELAMAHQAEKQAIPLTAEQVSLLQYNHIRAKGQVALKAHLASNPVSEQDIREEYQKVITATKGTMHHVRHMLFKDESDANAALDQIQQGELSYIEAEQAYLAARPNVANVGDLGWLNRQQLPESFAAVLDHTPSGQLHPKVVLSQFGAHVILIEGVKAVSPPPFEEVKEGIRKSLEKKEANRFRQLAQVKAKVKVSQP